MLQQYDEAADAFDMALEFDEDTNGELFISRGQALRFLDLNELALEDLNEAESRLPKNSRVYFERGHVYLKLKNYPQAIEDFDRVIELEPRHSSAYLNRGIAYYRLNDFDKAKMDYESALAIQKSPLVYQRLADIHLRTGQFDEALHDADEMIQLDPNSADAYAIRAAVYNAKRAYDQALTAAKRSLELDPNHALGKMPVPSPP